MAIFRYTWSQPLHQGVGAWWKAYTFKNFLDAHIDIEVSAGLFGMFKIEHGRIEVRGTNAEIAKTARDWNRTVEDFNARLDAIE